jgi:hypothetical protein
LIDLDWSYPFKTCFLVFPFQNPKKHLLSQNQTFSQKFCFLVLLEFFVFCFSIGSHDCHLYPYACLPYRSWDVKLWSKFLIQELARYVRPSLAYDVLWCSCTWILSQDLSSGFSFSVFQFFSFSIFQFLAQDLSSGFSFSVSEFLASKIYPKSPVQILESWIHAYTFLSRFDIFKQKQKYLETDTLG